MMSQHNFSPLTLAALTKAGWFPNRHMDTSVFREPLKAAGYPYHEAVNRFLEEFGGLIINFVRQFAPPHTSEMDINPPRDVAGCIEELFNINLEGQELNKPLCLIGFLDRDCPLMMSEDGSMYVSFNAGAQLVATSGAEAIESMVTNWRGQEAKNTVSI